MPLPFLKKKQEASASAPIDAIERKPDNEAEYDGLESAMEELATHLASKNYKAAAEAFRAAAQICDSEPHEEGPHEEQE